MKRLPNNFWTKDKCEEEALKYKTRKEYQVNSGSSYNVSRKNKWLDDMCQHMISFSKNRNYWTKERCVVESLKYKIRADFKNGSGSAYVSSLKNGWIDEICKHMKVVNRWSMELCIEEAKKYKSRREFRNKSKKCYEVVKKNKWHNVCDHMGVVGDKYNRLIYAYEFSDNYVYVGLTYDMKSRNIQHLSKKSSPIYKHIKKTGLTPVLKEMTEFLYVKIAQEMEGKFINKYKESGWNILNIAKFGSVGGYRID